MSINKVHIVRDSIPKTHINQVVRSPHTTLIDGVDLIPNEIYPTYIDLNDYSSIHIYGSTDTSFEFSVQLSNTARYISIYNGEFSHNLFLNYTLIR